MWALTLLTVLVMLASFVAVPRFASNASRRVVGQWGGAGGAICEDHIALAGSVRLVTHRQGDRRKKPVLIVRAKTTLVKHVKAA